MKFFKTLAIVAYRYPTSVAIWATEPNLDHNVYANNIKNARILSHSCRRLVITREGL